MADDSSFATGPTRPLTPEALAATAPVPQHTIASPNVGPAAFAPTEAVDRREAHAPPQALAPTGVGSPHARQTAASFAFVARPAKSRALGWIALGAVALLGLAAMASALGVAWSRREHRADSPGRAIPEPMPATAPLAQPVEPVVANPAAPAPPFAVGTGWAGSLECDTYVLDVEVRITARSAGLARGFVTMRRPGNTWQYVVEGPCDERRGTLTLRSIHEWMSSSPLAVDHTLQAHLEPDGALRGTSESPDCPTLVLHRR